MPPGNSGNRKAMTVPRSALQAHLNHGDYLGECKADEPATPAVKQEESKGNGNNVADTEKAEKEKMEKEKADKEKAEKEQKEKLEKEKADKEKADKEQKEKLEKEKADKEKADKEKAEKEKKKDNEKGKKDNNYATSFAINPMSLIASKDTKSFELLAAPDTTQILGKVKATVTQYSKTITSKGIMDMKIIDAKTNSVVMQEKIPAEYVWKSEWATFNGDERALSPEQLQLSNQKEQQPPSSPELFKLFTSPMFDQITTKLREFYKNY